MSTLLTQQEHAEKQKRQKGRLTAMFAFMLLLAGIMYGLTLGHT